MREAAWKCEMKVSSISFRALYRGLAWNRSPRWFEAFRNLESRLDPTGPARDVELYSAWILFTVD